MPKIGVAIVVDDEFRNTTKCRLCRESIGPHPFIIRFLLEEPTDLMYEHVHCAKTMAEAEDALDHA